MMKRIGFRGAVVAFVVAIGVGGTVAWAAIPTSVNGMITACYATSGASQGVLRVVDTQAGAKCAASEATVRWQSQGLRYTGPWSATTQYFVNDLVTDNGGAFIRIKTFAFAGVPTSNATFWVALSGGGSVPCTGYPHAGIDWSKAGSTPGTGCDFNGANLSNANLSNANLTNANLAVANFTSAQLNGANLSGASLAVTNFFHGILANANLNGASLASAFLAGADVSNADMTNANLTGANFGFAIGTGSIVYSNTTCPDGSNSDGNGGTCAGFGGGL